MNAEGFQKAMEFFRAAIDKDPNFALAHAGIANVFMLLSISNFAPPTDMWPKAKAAFQKALELDADLAEAHALAASLALWYEWDWDAAEKSFKRALALNPGNASTHGQYAWFCFGRKRFDETIKEIKLALNLDPLMPLFNFWSVGLHVGARRFDEAIEEFHKAIELDPNNAMAYLHVGFAYSQKGLIDNAIGAFQKAKELGVYAGWAETMLVFSYLAKGEKEKARQLFEDILEQDKKSHVSSVHIGWLWGAWGNFDRAFESLNKAYEERDTLMPFIHIYSDLLGMEIRKDPRYHALLKKMKLDE